MILRKINAVLSLIATLLFLDHAIFQAVHMLSEGGIKQSASFMPYILTVTMILHALLSIVLAILGHKGADKRKCEAYPKLNIATNIQRISGVLLILLTALHISEMTGRLQLPPAIYLILTPLFFAVALMHVAVSTSKAFITLGIGNAKTVKAVDIVMKILCAATLIADVVGFYLYLF